ncbi:transposase [Mucilaginibacter arboris]|nr:transposase [Mucilaginibacter arboris]
MIKSNKGLIAQIDKQIGQCLKEIKRLIELNKELKAKINKLNTIKGIGLITIVTTLAETMGFEQFNSAKQLVQLCWL